MNYLADQSYLAVKPQSDAGSPTPPAHFIPLISESVRVNPNLAADRRMKGIDWKSDELLRGARTVAGDIVVHADPDALAHLFNMAYSRVSTVGDAGVGYTHTFEPGEGKSYSIDIPRGTFAQRLFGVRAQSIRLGFEDNRLVATVAVLALGQYYAPSLAAALTGPGMTSLELSTESDARPADGLAIGDVLIVGAVEITITSVNANGRSVGFGATDVTAAIGTPVYLKAQTPTFGTFAEPLYLGGTLVGIGDDEAEATVNAGAKATATPCYGISATFMNNLLDAPATGGDGPAVLLNQVKECALELSRLFENPAEHRNWIERVKRAITVIATGRAIAADLSTREKLTVKAHKVKAVDNEEPLDSGGYIFDRQKFEALYDADDDESVVIEIVNRTPEEDLVTEEES